jgi:hypothetical protein
LKNITKENMARVASRKSCMKKVSRTLHKKATTKRQRKQIIGKASKACSRKMRVRRAGKKAVRKVIRKKSVRKVVPRQPPRQSPPPAPMTPPTPSIHTQVPPPSSDLFTFWSDVYKTYFNSLPCENIIERSDRERDELYAVMISNGGVPDEQEDAFEDALMTRLEDCRAINRASPPALAQIDDYSYEGYLQRFEEAAARVAGVQGECTPNALTRALRSESRNLLIDLNNEDRAAYEADPRRQNMIRAYEVVLGRCEADPFNNMVQARQAVQNV